MSDLVEYTRKDSDGMTDLVARGDTVQQIRTPYSTAVSVQRQRDIFDVEKRVTKEAQMLGEKFYYGWGSGKDRIEGMSIKGAMIVARCWGNCAVEPLPIQETADSWIMSAMFIDLETGFTLGRQFRQSKRWTVYGKHDAERKDDMRFQIGQSKAARNVIGNALPEWLIDKAIEAARSGVRANIEKLIAAKGIVHAVDKALAEFEKVGVTEAVILDKLGLAKRSAIELEHLVMLKGDLTAIQTGQERAEELFPTGQETKKGSKVAKSDITPTDDTDQTPGDPFPALRAAFARATTEDEIAAVYEEALSYEPTPDQGKLIEAWRQEAMTRVCGGKSKKQQEIK